MPPRVLPRRAPCLWYTSAAMQAGLALLLLLTTSSAAAGAADVEHPGYVTGFDTLFSRRLNRYYFHHREAKTVSWEKPAEPEAVFWWEFKSADCGYDDLEDDCVGDSLAACKEKCGRNPLCGKSASLPASRGRTADALGKRHACAHACVGVQVDSTSRTGS